MPENNLLLKGIELLCKSDEDVNRLIAPNSEKIITLLHRYINEVELFNPAYGLVGAENTDELTIKHILDSLAPAGIISKLAAAAENSASPQIADIGSGAGLPGIPLAITQPGCSFTLIERMSRRAGFLHNTKAILGLDNTAIEETQLEKSTPGRFDLITFRAFKPLEPKLLKALFKTCTEKGIIAAYKGKKEKIEEEMNPLRVNWEAIPYKVPLLDEERHLLVIRK